MTTGYAYHEVFGWHDTSSYAGLFPADPLLGLQPFEHMENAETKRRLHELVVVSGLIDHLRTIPTRLATDEEILRVHTPEHLARIVAESELPKGGDAGDGISPFGHNGIVIARRAAGTVIACLDAVLDGTVDNAYALVRPPGHHAIAGMGMGFCTFGNLAIAVAHAKAVRGVERIAVVDWDVHHGNGTQSMFYDDPDVLTISIHQNNVFPPASGALDERGEGPGLGRGHQHPAAARHRRRWLPARGGRGRGAGGAGVPTRPRARGERLRRRDHGSARPPDGDIGRVRAPSPAASSTSPPSAVTAGWRCPTRAATTRSTCPSAGSP